MTLTKERLGYLQANYGTLLSHQPMIQKSFVDKARKDLRLHAAVTQGDLTRVTELLEEGMNVDIADINGITPFGVSVIKGKSRIKVTPDNVEMMTLLTSKGANVTHEDLKGNSPLHLAAIHSSTKAFEFLLEAKVPMESVNRLGDSPLLIVCKKFTQNPQKDLFHLLELLINRTDLFLKDKFGKSPLGVLASKCKNFNLFLTCSL